MPTNKMKNQIIHFDRLSCPVIYPRSVLSKSSARLACFSDLIKYEPMKWTREVKKKQPYWAAQGLREHVSFKAIGQGYILVLSPTWLFLGRCSPRTCHAWQSDRDLPWVISQFGKQPSSDRQGFILWHFWCLLSFTCVGTYLPCLCWQVRFLISSFGTRN